MRLWQMLFGGQQPSSQAAPGVAARTAPAQPDAPGQAAKMDTSWTLSAPALPQESFEQILEDPDAAATNGQFRRAIARITVALALPGLSDSQRSHAHYLRGWTLDQCREPTDAISDYSAAIDLNGEDKWTFSSLVNRASCHRVQGNFERALADIDAALAIWPDHDVALCQQRYIKTAMEQAR